MADHVDLQDEVPADMAELARKLVVYAALVDPADSVTLTVRRYHALRIGRAIEAGLAPQPVVMLEAKSEGFQIWLSWVFLSFSMMGVVGNAALALLALLP